MHRWSGRDPYEPLTASVLTFLPPQEPRAPADPAVPFPQAAGADRAAAGASGAGPVEAWEAYTGTPLTLTARHDADGGLLLTLVHDRTRITDGDADEILGQTTRLLHHLPAEAGPGTTVAEALRA
ncbi:hypothetical protein PL81_06745, partial [Streptomyces sp. RSD-27]